MKMGDAFLVFCIRIRYNKNNDDGRRKCSVRTAKEHIGNKKESRWRNAADSGRR